MKKQTYSQPQAEIFELQLSGSVLAGGGSPTGFNDNNHTEYLGGEEDGGDLN